MKAKDFSPRQARRRLCRALFPLLLAAVLLAVRVCAGTQSAEALCAELSMLLIRTTLAAPVQDTLSLPTVAALSYFPPLLSHREHVAAAWSAELQRAPEREADSEDAEGTVLTAPQHTPASLPGEADNGVPSRTLRASDSSGYVVADGVYINNGSVCALDASMLTDSFSAECTAVSPQVLIVHTHGSEAYTMPAGEEYIASDDHRTTDLQNNMVRIGDELAQALTDAGLGVLHDRTLYDYPHYSGAYNRSLESVERYLAEYPSLCYVLDVHRDAVEDAEGNEYKLLCAEQPGAAQVEFVVGSSGGGAQHPRWTENLKLAAAVQRKLQDSYPTLMRPITVRNSRYNQHVLPGALLVEIGTAGNSLAEALCAARLFADGFAQTILAG